MVPFETQRLRLRQLRADDLDILTEFANHPDIARNTLRLPHPYKRSDAEWFLGYSQRGWKDDEAERVFAITNPNTDTFMGVIGIRLQPDQGSEIGYWMGVPHWNKGYMTEAVRRVIQYGFEELDVNRIYANYFTFNPASRRVMEKAGMTFEGILREHYLKDEVYIDVGVCSILRREWSGDDSSTD